MDLRTCTTRMPRQPKLRASCDQCGASKLKCDRGQPECERCISHGIPCVYGVSRKMGKPRRDRQQAQPGAAPTKDRRGRKSTSPGIGDRARSARGVAAGAGARAASDTPCSTSSACSTDTASTTADTAHITSTSHAASWDADVDNMNLDVLADVYSQNGNHHTRDLLDLRPPQYEQATPGLPTSFHALGFIDWASIADHCRADGDVPFSESGFFFAEPASGTPEFESPSARSHPLSNAQAMHPPATPHQPSEASWQPSPPPPTATSSSSGSSGSSAATITATPDTSWEAHDCAPKAYEILKMLSSLGRALQSGSGGGPGPSCGLDHLLRLNRKASEQLERLLACPCAGSPHLSLLYVSIISRILGWYQQAACCTGDAQPSWSPRKEEDNPSRAFAPDHHAAAASTPLSTPASSSSSSMTSTPLWECSSSPSSSASSSASSFTEISGSASIGGAAAMAAVAAPVKVAVGTFDVDDLSVQKAVKIQLLSGELRRAGRLIDKLAAHYTAAAATTAVSEGAHTSSLHHGLDAWLRGEHARIADLMRLRLKELNL
ncbi:hypothetical protein VTH06DRAFT_5935 [Thermothelomyces fergusii]